MTVSIHNCLSLQFSTMHLQQLRETIKGRKCEVHVSSLLGKDGHRSCIHAWIEWLLSLFAEAEDVEEKMSQLSISTKVRHTHIHVCIHCQVFGLEKSHGLVVLQCRHGLCKMSKVWYNVQHMSHTIRRSV